MTENRISLATPHMSDEGYELEYIHDAFHKNWIAPLGENVDEFEKSMCEVTGSKYAVALNSGTSAIHLALKAAGVGKGDIVFVQSLTFSASANPVIYEGATPVFIDSNRETWNMDPDLLEEAFQKYPHAKAVIPVHLYGVSTEIDRIKEICDQYDAVLIEDAAESLGTVYKGQWTGTFGDYGILSFNGNKIITTSGGGMVLTDNKERADKIRYWATQSREPVLHYEHKDVGYNYRLSNICAGIGRGQLKVLKDRIEKKRHIYQKYVEALSDISEIEFAPDQEVEYSNHWLSAFVINSDTVTSKEVIETLAKANIETRPVWKPMHMQPFFAECDYISGEEDISKALFENGVCLPSDTKMTDEEQDRVIEVIRGLWS